MSLPCLVWVLKHSEATHGRRLVLIALAEHAHDDGSRAFPSVETLMERTRLSRRGVQDALARLRDDGMIRPVAKSAAGTWIYHIIMGGAESAPPTSRGADINTSGAQNSAEKTSHSAPNPTTDPTTDPSEGMSPFQQVFEHWRARMGKNGATRLTPERRRVIEARLKDGYSVERIMRAVDGCAGSDFHMGREQKTRGQVHNDLTLICRNGSKLEQFEAMPPPAGEGPTSPYDRTAN